jgi:dipeptidyl aminopeptidase/acylaminoacyl peptidase
MVVVAGVFETGFAVLLKQSRGITGHGQRWASLCVH